MKNIWILTVDFQRKHYPIPSLGGIEKVSFRKKSEEKRVFVPLIVLSFFTKSNFQKQFLNQLYYINVIMDIEIIKYKKENGVFYVRSLLEKGTKN